MSTIASLVATLGLDASGFNSGIDGAEKKASGLSGSLSKIGLIGFGAATAGIAGVGAGLFSAVNTAREFEFAMDAVGAVSGASGQQLDALSAKAMALGESTAYGSTEVAGAMEVLVANGLTVDQVLSGAADAAVALAAAGGTTLAQAADTVSTSMAVWGLAAEDTAIVTNMLAGAANVSRFGVEDMALAIAQGGGAAATAGVSFEDFTTAVAAIAPNFSSGADAGTSLKTMLTRLVPSTEKASGAMKDLGLMTEAGMPVWFDAQGNFKGMSAVAEALNGSLAGLSDAQKTQALSTIFGSDAMRAAAGLAGMTGEEFNKMQQTMITTDAAAVAAQRMENLNGAMEQLGGAIETLQIKVGTALIPALTALVTFMADNIPVAAAAVVAGFHSFMSSTETVRAAIASFAATVIETVMPPLQQFADWFTSSQDAMGAAGAAIGGVLAVAFVGMGVAAAGAAVSVLIALAPIIAITAAAAALGAGIFLLIKHWDDITAKFPIAATALQAVKDGWASVLSWITGTFIPGVMGVADAIMDAGSRAVGFVQGHWSEIQTVIDGVLMFIITQVQTTFAMLGGIIEGALMVVSGIIKTVTGLLSGDWKTAWEGIKAIAAGVWTAITAVIEAGSRTVQNIFTNLGPALVAIMSMAWDLVKNVVSAAWDGIKAGVQAGADALPGLLSAAGGALQSAAAAAWDAVKSAVSTAWDAIKGFVSDGVQAIPGLISAGAGLLADAGTAIFNALWEAIKAIWGAIEEWVPTLPGIAADLIKGGAGLLLSAGEWILENFWTGLKFIWDQALAWAGTLPGLAKDAIVAGVSFLFEAGKMLIENMKTGLVSAFIDAKAYVAEMPGKIVEALGDTASMLYDAGIEIVQGLINGIKSMAGAAKNAVSGLAGDVIGSAKSGFGIFSPSRVFAEMGVNIVDGLIEGIDAKRDAAIAGMDDFAAKVAYVAEKNWADIGLQMKTIGDTAATDAGASFARRWMASLQEGIDAGMVSVATASSVMAGVLQTVMDPFAGSALYLGEGRGGPMAFLTLMQQRLDELVKNNTEMISDQFRYREGEDTTGLGLADGYYDRLARTIDLGNRRGSSGDDPKPTRPRWQREIEEILDTVPSGGMFDPLEAAISDILGDGIVDMSDVLKARTGGWDMLAEALMAGIAGTFSSADIAKLATLGLSDESMSAILGFFTKVGDVVEEITIPSERIDVPDTTRDDMWVPSAEDTAFTGNQTVVHVTVDGYVKDTDELIRDINQSIERAGGVAIGTLP